MFEIGPTMCISSTNVGKTQVGWVVVVGQKVQKWANANNTPPNGSPCQVPNSNEMTMRSPCLETFEKYTRDGHA
jgi:hypothetical protein